jgi:hypothetical protein
MDYAATMVRAQRELTVNLRSMIFMRKMREVTFFNPIKALRIIPSSDQEEKGIE